MNPTSLWMTTFLFLLLSIFVGCGRSEYQPLQQVVGGEWKHVDKIDVRYGDGTFITLTGPREINEILEVMKKIEVKATTKEPPVGFLFFIDIHENNQTYRISTNFHINNIVYEPSDPQTLDSFKKIVMNYKK